MNEINLLKYHNRSAREIHMLLNGELKDDLFSQLVLGGSFLTAIFASYFISIVYLDLDPPIPYFDKEAIKRKVAEYQLNKRTGGDEFLKSGYEKLGVVEQSLEGNTAAAYVESQFEFKEDNSRKPELFIKPLKLEGEPLRKKIDKSKLISPVLTGNNAIRFKTVSSKEMAIIKDIAVNNDLKYRKLGSSKKRSVVWQVYREDKSSSRIIGGKPVRYVKSFKRESQALRYIKSMKRRGVVTSKTTYTDYFDVEICCLGDEAAEKFARGSGISMKKIKIIKK